MTLGLLSENPTYLHFPLTDFCCLDGKANGLLKFQPYLVAFGVIVIDNKKSKTIDLYMGRHSSKYSFGPKYTHAYLARWLFKLRNGDDTVTFYHNVTNTCNSHLLYGRKMKQRYSYSP